MLKKVILLTAPTLLTLFLSVSAHGQDLPSGPLNRLINCSINPGKTMAQVVEWAKTQPVTDATPNAIFFREAIMAGNYRESYDFTIAAFFPSYAEMNRKIIAGFTLPDTRMRTGTRGTDLFTCDPNTLRINHNRFVNGGNNDGFSGDVTIMQTRFCRINEGQTVADAWEFAQGVASNYADAGDNSLYQMWTRELGPVGNTVAGGGVVLSTVPSTPEASSSRLDMRREGFDPLEGLRPLPVSCDYPSVWRTYAIHRGGNN